jgi:predicted ATPase
VVALADGRWTLARSVPDIAGELPESIRSMIQRKIERLGDANRKLLLAASVQGYAFDSAVIARATGADPADVEDRLQELEHTHVLVRAVGEHEFPDRTLTVQYRFVHALYHDALFRTLTPARRGALARAVGESMLAFYGDEGARLIAAQLALLFETARDFDHAVHHFLIAADNAAQVFAHHESASLARKALSLLFALPPSPARSADELGARMTLGVALMATQGFSAAEVEQTFRRARELCEELGPGPNLFRALWGLWTVHVIRAEFQVAQVLADEMMNAAAANRDLLMPAHYAQAMTSDYVGDHRTARANYEQLISLYDPQLHRSHIYLYGLDLKTVALSRLCWITWALGYADDARRLLEECVTFARHVAHPYSTSCALLTTPQLCWDFDEPHRAQQLAEEAMAVSSDQGFPLSLAYAAVHHGWAIAKQGRLDEGLDEMRRSFAMLHAMGAEMSWTGYQVSMAEVLGDAGRVAEGIEVANQGLARAEALGERFFEAELYRVRADLRWKAAEDEPIPDIEQDYARALDVARARGSKSHELRAAMGLARVWRYQGEPGRARDLLRPLVGWFTQGLDTPDLRRASTLLTALGQTGEP